MRLLLFVLGSDATTQDALTVIGFLAQQTSIIGSRRVNPGSSPAIEIIQTSGQELADPKFVENFFHRLAHMDAKLAPGFSSVEIEGRPGIYIINPEGSWTFKDFLRFDRVISNVSKELNITTSVKRLQVDYIAIGNDWKSSPKGEQYLERLTARGLTALRDKLVNVYQPQVEQWIAKAFERHAPGTVILPFAKALRPRPAVRQRLYTRQPPAQKQRRQDYINRP